MTKLLMYVLLTLLPLVGYAQSVSYGLPILENELHEGDLIILNIPPHIDGRIKLSRELDKLKLFVEHHEGKIFSLEVYIFGGTSKFCLAHSKFLSRSLSKRLNVGNVKFTGRGDERPILDSKSSPMYFSMNTRIELTVIDTL